MTIDILFLDSFICQLSIFEKEWMENYEERRPIIEPVFNKQVDRELWKLENMKIINSFDIYKKHIGNFDDWKFRYYEHHIGCSDNQEQTIGEMCQNYLDGLMWITKYYFSNCPSWDWSYKFPSSPFITDISKFLKSYHYNINNTEFEINQPLNATIQLLCVLPKEYNYLMHTDYKKLIENISIGDLFPS